MIVIIGAGIAGLAMAWELARNGNAIALIDRGPIPGDGASAVPSAILNVQRGRSARAHVDDLAALEVTTEVMADLERSGLLERNSLRGVVRIAQSEKQMHRWAQLGGRTLEERDLQAEFQCSIAAPHGAVWFARGGFIDTVTFLSALVSALEQRDVTFFPHSPVSHVEPGSGADVVRVHMQRDVLDARAVITCTGPDPNPWDPELGQRWLDGEEIQFPTPSVPSHDVPILGRCYATFRNGITTIGGNHRNRATPGGETAADMTAEACRMLPWLTDVASVSTCLGTRVALSDNRPRIHVMNPRFVQLVGLAGRGYLAAHWLSRTVRAHLVEHGAAD